jgi:hypothetical protein
MRRHRAWRVGVDDSMDCGEEILGVTNSKVERQPHQQPQEDISTQQWRGRKWNKGEGSRKSGVGSGGESHSTSRGREDRDPIQQSQKNKKMEIESIGERSHVR